MSNELKATSNTDSVYILIVLTANLTVLVRKTHPTKANVLFGFGINLENSLLIAFNSLLLLKNLA